MELNIHNLFPTPVGFFNFDRKLTDQEISYINSLETRPNAGNTTSKNNMVLHNKELILLRSFIEDSVSEYFKKTLNPKHNVNLRLTQSWCNFSYPGQFHHRHAHPNSFISGVFYIKTNPTDKIMFFRSGWNQIKLPPNEWNQYNSESWWFEATEGKLILFPSSLEHMVPNVEGDDIRISLSFNTFPVGMIGEEVDLTGLTLMDAMWDWRS
jgi:uncharacterized protein (TIGR02466 family)